ncbi:TetR/AcrR family transcriptional regulator [Mycolicibacterium austroafricanum]|uniref:TetR/AcrR family transcriptional regulator n=1 Tax=Mycolicibacterium austroafricanum TaxID=39687 RepID=UPI001CA38567|nr:TetR/AcrR family transcriptional regulator [Mycolicibacterium austroafricanum]QZT59590.1 TetR/AcrR family transcriptional regulator [Mycolicibacterium austroafricanum]
MTARESTGRSARASRASTSAKPQAGRDSRRAATKRAADKSSAAAPGQVEDSKSALTRARILDAAAHVLSVKGYSGLRLSDVAAQAELRAPAIYYYYESRDQLIEEVMWVGIADMRRHVATALDQLPAGTSSLDRLLVAAEAHLRHALEISDYTTASIRNAGQVPLGIRKRQILEEERYGEIWRKLINELARDGLLRPELDLYIAQMLILGALNWAVEWWHPRRGSIEAVVANAQSVIRHGLTDQ